VQSVFKAPVQQVAAGSIHNEHHHHHTEPPGPDEACEQVRDCPQCTRRTWALSQHCHHCRLDLWAYERRARWQTTRRRLGLVMVCVALLMMYGPIYVHAATRIDKQAAEQLVRDMDSVSYGLYTALGKPADVMAMGKKTAGFSERVRRVLGDPVFGQPLFACSNAATQASMVWGDAYGLALNNRAPTQHSVSSLARSAISFGDNYRQCRIAVEALP
jgi:hypothetical protein